MVRQALLAALLLVSLLAQTAAASIPWIKIADVSKIHEAYNTTAVFRARWWDIKNLPVDIDLPPTAAILVKLTAKLSCQNGIPPRYNVTFYVSFAGHNMTKKVPGYGTSGASYLGYLMLNKTVDSKLHIDLATDAKGCKPYLSFAMVYYNAALKETIDWQPPGNATITFNYKPPKPSPEKLDIAYMIELDPRSTTTTLTMPPSTELLVPVTDELVNKAQELFNMVYPPLKVLANHIINKTIELAKNKKLRIDLESLPPETLVALSLRPAKQVQGNKHLYAPPSTGQGKIDLYTPKNAPYIYLVPANVSKVYNVHGANYTLISIQGSRVLALKNLGDHVEAYLIIAAPLRIAYYTPGMKKQLVVPGDYLYLPAEVNADVHYVSVDLDAQLPNATRVTWKGNSYTVTFAVNESRLETSIRVNNATISKKMVVSTETVPVCYYMDHKTCGKLPMMFAYSQWGFLKIRSYNETVIDASYIIPSLFNITLGNKTIEGILANDKLAVLVYGVMKPETNLAGLRINGSVEGALVVISDVPRRARVEEQGWHRGSLPGLTVYEPMEAGKVYVTAFNVYDYRARVEFSARVGVHVRDASTSSPVAAEILALQNSTVVDRARGSDVVLKLFPGNYTIVARIGGLPFYRNVTVRDDMDITIKVVLPKVTNVSVEAPRYSFGETELRITLRLDKPAPADYNITGRIIVDGSWERNFTIPVKANSTEASTVVKLNLGEGKHKIRVIVGDAAAEVEVTVAGGTVGFAAAAIATMSAVGVILFIIRRPREIAF